MTGEETRGRVRIAPEPVASELLAGGAAVRLEGLKGGIDCRNRLDPEEVGLGGASTRGGEETLEGLNGGIEAGNSTRAEVGLGGASTRGGVITLEGLKTGIEARGGVIRLEGLKTGIEARGGVITLETAVRPGACW